MAKNLLARTAESLHLQLTQRALDRELGTRFPHKAWSRFCQAGKWDATVARTGKGSLAVVGGTYTATDAPVEVLQPPGRGAVRLARTRPLPSPSCCAPSARPEKSPLPRRSSSTLPAAPRRHFDAREGHTYCMHLYLDYQDGQWPEVHTALFSPGTHDWERRASAWTRRVR